MNLLADECVDSPVVERLRRAGLSDTSRAEAVAEVFRDRAHELVGAFSVIAPGVVRIRQAPKQ